MFLRIMCSILAVTLFAASPVRADTAVSPVRDDTDVSSYMISAGWITPFLDNSLLPLPRLLFCPEVRIGGRFGSTLDWSASWAYWKTNRYDPYADVVTSAPVTPSRIRYSGHVLGARIDFPMRRASDGSRYPFGILLGISRHFNRKQTQSFPENEQGTRSRSISLSYTSLDYGAFVKYRLSEHVSLRGEYRENLSFVNLTLLHRRVLLLGVVFSHPRKE